MNRWLLILLFLAGCSALPPRDVYVVMTDPPCGSGPELRLVRFVDTLLPLSACVAASSKEDAAAIVLLTLIGMPMMACAVTVYATPGRAEQTTIYAAISPSPAQLMTAALTLHSPDDVLQHELQHAFGRDHGGKCR